MTSNRYDRGTGFQSMATDHPIDRYDQPHLFSIGHAFEYCEEITRRHYENFPVASLFIPASLRPYVAAIYAFARTADDFADEGKLSAQERLARLDEWEEKLDRCFEGVASDPIFVALAETVSRCGIPKKPLSDLLIAFRVDVTRNRFPTFHDLLEYCTHSANPVGRLVLYIFSSATDRMMGFADNICTALQLANFWQDVSLDWQKGRVYLPLEDLQRFGYTENDLAAGTYDERFRKLVKFQVDRTKRYFESGKPLLAEAPDDLKFELRLTWFGGQTILKKIEQADYDVLTKRLVITSLDKAGIFMKAIVRRVR